MTKITRIIKYGKLREKIKREIKILLLEKEKPLISPENLERINQIDKNIFFAANQMKNKIFPELTSFTEQQNLEKTELTKNKIEKLTKLEIQINGFYKAKNSESKSIDDLIAKLTNETFLLQKHANLVSEKQKLKAFFAENISSKIVINPHDRKVFKTVSKNELVSEILENNRKISKQINRIEKNLFQKKAKTFWLFVLSMILLITTLTIVIITLFVVKI